MTSFTGTMRIEGGGPAVPVEARVGEERLTLRVEGMEVGVWPVDGLHPEIDAAGVVLRLGEEQVTLDVSDRAALLGALSPAAPPRKTKRRRKPSLPLLVTAVFVLAVVAAAILAPELVGSVALVVGLVALVTGALAQSEPRVALRLPVGLQPLHFIAAGLAMLGVGIALVLVG